MTGCSCLPCRRVWPQSGLLSTYRHITFPLNWWEKLGESTADLTHTHTRAIHQPTNTRTHTHRRCCKEHGTVLGHPANFRWWSVCGHLISQKHVPLCVCVCVCAHTCECDYSALRFSLVWIDLTISHFLPVNDGWSATGPHVDPFSFFCRSGCGFLNGLQTAGVGVSQCPNFYCINGNSWVSVNAVALVFPVKSTGQIEKNRLIRVQLKTKFSRPDQKMSLF